MICNENNNNWFIALNYIDANGRRHHLIKRGFKTQSDAKKYEDAFLLRMQNAQKNGG